MLYDIASKRLAQIAPASFLSFLLQAPIDPAARFEDLPQEMPTLNRADHVWRVSEPGTEPYLVLSEFLTHWDAEKKLDMAIYTLWLKRKYRIRVIPVVLLCLPNQNADDTYTDENCQFKFRLLKASELNATALFESGQLSLYPLLPILRGGLDLASQAGKVLYESGFDRSIKGDLIALLGLFLGLTDRQAAANLLWNRTELMNILAESPVYQQIREEGRREGLVEALKLGLELRFGSDGIALFSNAERCGDLSILSRTLDAIRNRRPLAEVAQLLSRT